MIRRRRSRPPRGIMLLEVLISLSMMAVFATLSVELVKSSLRTSKDVGDAAGRSARFDGAVAQLRRDVWNATRVETPDVATVHIKRPEGAPITWAVTKEGGFTRTVESDHQEWPEVAAGMKFESNGSVLSLIELPNPRDAGRRMTFVSQLALSNNGGQK